MDIIARLIAKTTGFDQPLAKSMAGVQKFGQANFTMNGILAQGLTALTKMAKGFGAVEVACKTFNAVIMEGSQTTGDFVRNGVGALNDTMGLLARSLATCDFTAFNQGLIQTYANAVKLREQLDGLNDMAEATSYFKKKYTAQLSDARETLADPASSAEDIANAIAKGDKALANMKSNAQNLSDELKKTATNMLDWETGVGGSTVDLIEKLESIKLKPEDEEKTKKAYRKMLPQQSDYMMKTISYSSENLPMVTDTVNEAAYLRDFNKAMQDSQKAEAQIGLTFLELDDTKRKQIIGYLEAMQEEGTAMSQLQRSWDRQKRTATKGLSSTTAGSIGKTATGVTSQMEVEDMPMRNPFATTESKKSLQDKIVKIQAQLDIATDPMGAGKLEKKLEDYQKRLDAQPLALRLGISTDAVLDIQSDFQDLATSMQGSMQKSLEDMSGWLDDAAGSSKNVSKEGKVAMGDWKQAASAVSQLGGALQGVDSKGVNIAGIIMQAVANVALGFAQALANPESGAAGVFGWIAAAVSGLATMTATIVSIKKATSGSYAEGGIVPGSYNGGVDSTYVYASPGEVILNRAQQQNLLSQIDSNSNNGGGRTIVRGEQIMTALNNYGRRKGYGEVAWQ